MYWGTIFYFGIAFGAAPMRLSHADFLFNILGFRIIPLRKAYQCVRYLASDPLRFVFMGKRIVFNTTWPLQYPLTLDQSLNPIDDP